MPEPSLIGSILTSVKKNCNIPEDVTVFDPDIIMHINSTFAQLNQMGVGPKETFMIEDDSAQWDDFSTNLDINMVRSYMYLEVRLLFDPPTASVLSSLEKKRDEYAWRLNVADDDLLYATTEEVEDE